MCQILCITKHNPEKRDELILSVWHHMAYTGGQHDGFGAAWFSPDGQIGYHKSSVPMLNYPTGLPGKVAKFLKKGFFDAESNDVPSDGGFLIIHGRNATCQINVDNTHPMLVWGQEDGPIAAMVHNGVVRSYKYKPKDSTCDSEMLIQAYVFGGMAEVEKEIYGSYGFMHLQLINDKKTLHVAKDSKAKLHCGIINGTIFSFATTESLLDKVGASHVGEVQDNNIITFVEDDPDFVVNTFVPNLSYGPPSYSPILQDWQDRQAFGVDGRVNHTSWPPKTMEADAALAKAIDEAVNADDLIKQCSVTEFGEINRVYHNGLRTSYIQTTNHRLSSPWPSNQCSFCSI